MHEAILALVLGCLAMLFGWIPLIGWLLVAGSIWLGYGASRVRTHLGVRSMGFGGMIAGILGGIVAIIVTAAVVISMVHGPAASGTSALGDAITTEAAHDPIDTVRAYLSVSNYTTLAEFSTSYAQRHALSVGSVQEVDAYWQAWAGNMSQVVAGEQQNCQDAKELSGEDLCHGAWDQSTIDANVGRTIDVISLQTTETSATAATVRASIMIQSKTDGQWNTTSANRTYVLENQSGWKIVDIISDDGPLSKTFNVTEARARDELSFRDLRSGLAELTAFIARMRELHSVQTSALAKVSDVLGAQPVVTVNYLDNRSDQYVVNVAYYVDDSAFSDEYLQVAKDGTGVFKAVFPIDAHIRQVQITAVKRYKDDYGNPNSTVIAKTLMERDVYNKINWDGFEYANLAKITPLDFSGDSTYKRLMDLQSSLQAWNTMYQSSSVPTGGNYDVTIVAGMCAQYRRDCQEKNNCDGINLLTTEGTC